jgi:hypothetical protein
MVSSNQHRRLDEKTDVGSSLRGRLTLLFIERVCSTNSKPGWRSIVVEHIELHRSSISK